MGGGIQDPSSRSGGKKRKDDGMGSFGGKKEGFGEQLSSGFYFFFSFNVEVHTVGKDWWSDLRGCNWTS